MYVPITWANPYDLDLIKEKRKRKRNDSDFNRVRETGKEQDTTKTKAFVMLFRTLAFGRMF